MAAINSGIEIIIKIIDIINLNVFILLSLVVVLWCLEAGAGAACALLE